MGLDSYWTSSTRIYFPWKEDWDPYMEFALEGKDSSSFLCLHENPSVKAE